MARLLDAGLPPDTLYSTLAKGFRSPAILGVVEECRLAVVDGRPLSDGLRAAAPDIPPLHALAVAAAEVSGDLPPTLRELADGEEERLQARRDLVRRSAYPVLLAHLAILAPNVGVLVMDLPLFFAIVLPPLLLLDGALLLGWRALKHPPGGEVGRALLRVPMLGELIRAASYRSYFRALGYLYEAGVPLPRAARDAAATIGSPSLRDAVELALAPVDRAEPLAEVWPGFPDLREEVRASLVTAEPAGELGSALAGAARFYAEGESDLRRQVSKTAAGIIYFAAVTYVVIRVVTFYADYFDLLGSL